jgi:hypothetical protein
MGSILSEDCARRCRAAQPAPGAIRSYRSDDPPLSNGPAESIVAGQPLRRVRDKLKRFGLFAGIGASFFFSTIESAADSDLQSHAVDWTDRPD